MRELGVVGIWGAVQQEEAEVKYHSCLTLMFALVPQAHGDLVIYGAALEEQIRIQLPHSCTQTCEFQTQALLYIQIQ